MSNNQKQPSKEDVNTNTIPLLEDQKQPSKEDVSEKVNIYAAQIQALNKVGAKIILLMDFPDDRFAAELEKSGFKITDKTKECDAIFINGTDTSAQLQNRKKIDVRLLKDGVHIFYTGMIHTPSFTHDHRFENGIGYFKYS